MIMSYNSPFASRLAPVLLLLSLVGVGCAYIRPGENEPVLSRVPPQFRIVGRPVVHLLMDGCRADVLYELADSGQLPNIKKYLVDRGTRVENAMASLTSTTFANISVQLTGKVPGHLDFPGNAWLDRKTFILRKINSARSVNRINTDITGPTMAETIGKERPDAWCAVIEDTLTRGARYANPLREWLGVCYFIRRWRLVDRFAIEAFHDVLLEANRRGTFPAHTFVHLIATDNTGHIFGPASQEYRDCIKHEDEQIGRLIRTFQAMGLADKICLVITADHGMAPVRDVQELILHDFITNSLGIRCAYEPVEEDKPIAQRQALLSQFRAVETTSGDRYCFVYLSNPDSNPQGLGRWSVVPSIEQMRHFRNDSGNVVNVVETLRRQPAVDLICARDDHTDCHIYSRSGESIIRATGDIGARRYAYSVKAGQDPLGYESVRLCSNDLSRFHTADEWFEATSASERPNSVPEIYDLFDSPRAGDLVLFAAPGWNFKDTYKGAHGAATRADMRIPMIIAGPGIRHGVLPRARAADLVPTFLDYMGIKSDVKFDGRSLLKQLE